MLLKLQSACQSPGILSKMQIEGGWGKVGGPTCDQLLMLYPRCWSWSIACIVQSVLGSLYVQIQQLFFPAM